MSRVALRRTQPPIPPSCLHDSWLNKSSTHIHHNDVWSQHCSFPCPTHPKLPFSVWETSLPFFFFTLKLFIHMGITLPRHNANTGARTDSKICGKCICNTFQYIAQYLEEIATRWDRCRDVTSCVFLCAYTKATINEHGTDSATQFYCEYMKLWCVKVQMMRVCCTSCTPVFFAVTKNIIGACCMLSFG